MSPETSSRRLNLVKIAACQQCKTSKTRCEILNVPILDPAFEIKCHRCDVLGISCSYVSLDRSILQPLIPSPAPETPAQWKPSLLSSSLRETEKPSSNIPVTTSSQFRPDDSPPYLFPAKGFWNYIDPNHACDWHSPLAAMQKIHILLPAEVQIPDVDTSEILDVSFENILSRDQVDHLLKMFISYHEPWLGLRIIRNTETPLLDLVCCTISSRHLDPALRSAVAGRLQNLTERIITTMLFNPSATPSLEGIQSLLILAIWCPLPMGSIQDGRVLIAPAVSMALNLHINDASEKLVQKKYADAAEMAELGYKARIWNCLANVDSMLRLGSDTVPLARRGPSDIKYIRMPVRPPASAAECCDMRLRLVTEMYCATEQAASHQIHQFAQFDTWYEEITKVLAGPIGSVARMVLPLAIVTEHDPFHCHMLILLLHTCRLMILYRAFNDVRIVFTRERPSLWANEVRPGKLNVVTMWGREIIVLSESILVAAIQADVTLLQTSPDHLFNMISFAAALSVGVKLILINMFGLDLPGSIAALMKRLIKHLQSTSACPDAPAITCSRLLTKIYDTLQHAEDTMQRTKLDSNEMNHIIKPEQIEWKHQELLNDQDLWAYIFQNLGGRPSQDQPMEE
ncbi:hypothetical protein C8J56DRAFT_178642 [Mycena floridula]|nr:hypothetical protein C8J56DRAFT_178642 [Mycena floridula]